MTQLRDTVKTSYDAEGAVLNILLNNPDMINELINLRAHMFSSSPYALIFSTMLELRDQKLLATESLVITYLKSRDRLNNIGGEETIHYLKAQAYDAENVKEFERQIITSYKTRELIRQTSGIPTASLNSDNIDNVISDMQLFLNNLTSSSGGEETKSFSNLIETAYLNIVQRTENPGVPGISTKISSLDLTTGGMTSGDLWIIAGRPSMGKSALMANLALNIAKNSVPVLIFSLEMSAQLLMERFISVEGKIPIIDVRLGKLEQKQINAVSSTSKSIKDLPIFLDCKTNIDLSYILSTIRKYKKLHDVKVVFLDYLQLLSERDEGQTAELGRITKGLKAIARELDITVVALSQINRAVEMRENKRPILSDLRQSGNIEEDADLVIFLYRDDYYDNKSKYPGQLELIIRKNRSGPTGSVFSKFDLITNKIEEE